MKVSDCLKAIDGELISGTVNKVFRGVSIDSRTLKENELFICIRGDRFDGHNFIKEVKNKKPSAVIISDTSKLTLKDDNSPSIIRVSNTLKALQELARFYREQFSIKVVGWIYPSVILRFIPKIVSKYP